MITYHDWSQKYLAKKMPFQLIHLSFNACSEQNWRRYPITLASLAESIPWPIRWHRDGRLPRALLEVVLVVVVATTSTTAGMNAVSATFCTSPWENSPRRHSRLNGAFTVLFDGATKVRQLGWWLATYGCVILILSGVFTDRDIVSITYKHGRPCFCGFDQANWYNVNTYVGQHYAQTPWFARTATLKMHYCRTWYNRLHKGCRINLGFRVLAALKFQALGFTKLWFRIRRLGNTETLALRRYLSMSKDNVSTPREPTEQPIGSCRDIRILYDNIGKYCLWYEVNTNVSA